MTGGEEFYLPYIMNCAFNVFLCYTTIMLNSVTIYAIRQTSSLPKPLKTLLLSLAISDLGVVLLAQPFYIALLVMRLERNTENNPGYNVAKVAYLIPTNLFVIVSFFGVTTLIVDRFLAVHLHLRYQKLVTYKRIASVVISVWVLGTTLSLSRLWMSVITIYIIFGIIYAACLIFAAFLSYKIYMAVRQHQEYIQTLRVLQVAQNVEMANAERRKKSVVAAIYIYLVFVLCYLPNICMLWIMAGTSNSNIIIMKHYTLTMVFLNSSLNPLIYCWKMRHIRHNIINILRNVFSSYN